jgi:hypothetical protein
MTIKRADRIERAARKFSYGWATPGDREAHELLTKDLICLIRRERKRALREAAAVHLPNASVCYSCRVVVRNRLEALTKGGSK